ncbi:MAG: CBS domain-containing protein [Cyanobacteria bacterium P01_E01_bin.45]
MLKAKDIMTSDVVTIRGSATVAEAIQVMKDKGLRSLIVERRTVDDPYGIVTETDIIYKVAAFGSDPKTVRVFEIMNKPCITVSPDLGVEYVARLFANTCIRRAPVIEKDLLGIISVSDLLVKGNFVEQPKRMFIEDELEAAREDARAICDEKGDTSRECAAAWDAVEELLAETAHRRVQKQAVSVEASTSSTSGIESPEDEALTSFCSLNPDDPACRVYED